MSSTDAACQAECASGGCPRGDLEPCSAVPAAEFYPKPFSQGPPPHFGQSPVAFGGPECELDALLAWKWHHPDGRYGTVITSTPLVDDAEGVYISSLDGVRKLSLANGSLLWEWRVANLSSTRHAPNNAAIMNGRLFTCLTTGEVLALSMATGTVLWRVLAEPAGIGWDTSFMSAVDGKVLLDVVRPQPPQFWWPAQHNHILALDAEDGRTLWRYRPDVGVWNFMPLFPGDGSAVFQAWTGAAYRINLTDGAEIWRAGESLNDLRWTDGGPALGPNGIFYTVTSSATMSWASRSGRGAGGIFAWNATDGTPVWNVTGLDEGIYTFPVVGSTAPGEPPSLVTTVGSLGGFPLGVLLWMARVVGCTAGTVLGLLVATSLCCMGRGLRQTRLSWCWILFWRPALLVAVLSLICAVAFLALLPRRTFSYSLQAFDAGTGRPQWKVELPEWRWYAAAGDEEGFPQRRARGVRDLCMPCASSGLVLDAQGAVYFGHTDGRLYRVKDWDSSGGIDKGGPELCSVDVGGGALTGSPTIVPGHLLYASCDGVYAFRDVGAQGRAAARGGVEPLRGTA